MWGLPKGDFSPLGFPRSLDNLEVGLPLVHGLDHRAVRNHLAQESGHTRIGQFRTLGDFLNQLGHGVEPIGGHTLGNSGLDAVIRHLLGGGLLLTGVLLRQEFQFVLHERNLGRVGQVGLNLLEHLTLGHLLSSSHSINSFLVWRVFLPFDYIVSQTFRLVNTFFRFSRSFFLEVWGSLPLGTS